MGAFYRFFVNAERLKTSCNSRKSSWKVMQEKTLPHLPEGLASEREKTSKAAPENSIFIGGLIIPKKIGLYII